MKIKTVKKLNLHELIKHVWENGISNSTFIGVYGASWTKIFVNHHGVISVNNVSPLSVFEISVEEELTEGTELCGVTTFIKKPRGIFPVYRVSASIGECLESLTDDDIEPLKIFNGVTEIWTKEHGIPESGVLEVGAE